MEWSSRIGGAECTEARYFLHLWVTAEQTHTHNETNKEEGRLANRQEKKRWMCPTRRQRRAELQSFRSPEQ